MNSVVLVGNIGKDAACSKFNTSSGEVSKAVFSLAVSRGKDETDWISCEAIGKIVDNLGQYLTSGKKIAVHGQIRVNSWEDKDTKAKRYSTVVRVNDIELLTPKSAAAAVKTQPEFESVIDETEEIY